MSGDPGLVHAKHSCGGRLVALGRLPVSCPCCFQRLSPTISLSLLFGYPIRSPDRISSPHAIVMRSTHGNLLTDYSDLNPDLHIGLTTSTSELVEFDITGLQRGAKWPQCLSIFRAEEPWIQDLWDEAIDTVIDQYSWSAGDYHPQAKNCYTFVLAVIKSLPLGSIAEAAHSKTDFCQRIVAPKAATAIKYISLYRSVIESDERAINISE